MKDVLDSRTTRRELLKLSPLLLLGGFAVPAFRERLLDAGIAWSDTASAALVRTGHRTPVFADTDAVPFERFPYNGYDVLQPSIDFDRWVLTVGGAVTRAGRYSLDQIRALPKVTQNTRHVCVEGWDAIGRFGGSRLGDFSDLAGPHPRARFLTVAFANDLSESLVMAQSPALP